MATRTYNAIDKTIDGLKLEEFDEEAEQLAQPFNNQEVYDIGRYVVYDDCIYQKIVSPQKRNIISRPYIPQLETGNIIEDNGITWTINTNGSITADGTATDDSTFIVNENITLDEDTDYTVSGCPENGTIDTYYEELELTSGNVKDYGSGIVFANLGSVDEIRCVIKSGITVNDLTFYPQLELGHIRTSYQQPNKLNEEFIPSHWRLIREL